MYHAHSKETGGRYAIKQFKGGRVGGVLSVLGGMADGCLEALHWGAVRVQGARVPVAQGREGGYG